VEFSEDSTGYLQTTEWPIFIFDALLILVTMVIFNIIHPTRYLVVDPGAPMKNPSTINQPEVNGVPVVTMEMVTPVESIQHA
jgi:hypothetical protein